MKKLPLAAALMLALPAAASPSSDKEELLKLKNTTVNLIDALVQQGILDKKKAEAIIKEAESKAAVDAKKEMEQEKADVQKTEAAPPPAKPGEAQGPAPVRVTYVPDFVKEEIRNEVRAELKNEVVKEVKAEAKKEKWGIPAALPDWVNRFKLSGDFRTRYEGQYYGDNNLPYSYIAWPVVNAEGGIIQAGRDAFFDTTQDRDRYRIRMRLALEAQIDENFKAGIRLATSNDRSPISINQTLGQYGRQYELALDRAFLQYDYIDSKNAKWATVWAGRFVNPWFSTDNVHDPDLSFEGIASTLSLPIGDKAAPLKQDFFKNGPQYRQINMGFTAPDSLYLTLGAFPLQEIALSSHDKWMWGAQSGLDWMFGKDSRMKLGVAYYDYRNVSAIPNPYGSRVYDWTAPEFFTKGNSIARISNDVGELPANPRLVGLAADFNVIDAIASLDYSGFGDNHIMLTGNYSNNLGFDKAEIKQRTGESIARKTQAYQVRLDVGRPEITKFGDWSTFFAYKYLERDSVMDAFADSNFHLAGTDAKGWVLGGVYGVAKNTWLNARWMSTSAVDGPPFDIDILLLDLNARF